MRGIVPALRPEPLNSERSIIASLVLFLDVANHWGLDRFTSVVVVDKLIWRSIDQIHLVDESLKNVRVVDDVVNDPLIHVDVVVDVVDHTIDLDDVVSNVGEFNEDMFNIRHVVRFAHCDCCFKIS